MKISEETKYRLLILIVLLCYAWASNEDYKDQQEMAQRYVVPRYVDVD